MDNGRQNAQKFDKEMLNHTDGTAAGLQASAAKCGIDLCLVLPIATSARPSPRLNDTAALVDKMAGLRSFGSVHPLNPEWESELVRLAGLGLRGIKLHPEYQGCFADAPETVNVVRTATELGLYVYFHAGADVGMPDPVHGTVRHFVNLRNAVPDARLILAHMGGFYMWEEVLAALDDLHAYIDTGYSVMQYPQKQELFARIIEKNTPKRVLFGTDCPWEDQASSVRNTLDFLKRYGFSETDRNAIMGENALALLA